MKTPRNAPLPACVSATGAPVASARRASCACAPAYSTPPPAISSGAFAPRSAAANVSISRGSGGGARIRHTRRSKKCAG
jgi:hypothetical protein